MRCQEVCSAWRRYLQSSNIWEKLLRNEALKAERFAIEARSSVAGVGEGWLQESVNENFSEHNFLNCLYTIIECESASMGEITAKFR